MHKSMIGDIIFIDKSGKRIKVKIMVRMFRKEKTILSMVKICDKRGR